MKESTTLFSEESSKIINIDTIENKENLIYSDILKTGPLKDARKIGQFKYHRKYISNNGDGKL